MFLVVEYGRCFNEAEKALGFALLDSLKNTLKRNGFSNAKVIQNITDEDLKVMETFMQETAPSLISLDEYKTYYGIFHANSKNFQFLQGHKKKYGY